MLMINAEVNFDEHLALLLFKVLIIRFFAQLEVAEYIIITLLNMASDILYIFVFH